MTLYEIDQQMESLVDPETGELLDYEAFEQLHMERTDKLENMALWYKELIAKAQAIKAEADVLTERRRAIERKAERLKEYLGLALNGEKFSTARCAVSFRTSKSLEVRDIASAVYWLYENGHCDLVVRPDPQLDKRAVKELVNQGHAVDGVELVEKQSTQIR